MNWNIFENKKSYLDRIPSLPKLPELPSLKSFSNVPVKLKQTLSFDNKYLKNKWVQILSGLILVVIILRLLNHLNSNILKRRIVARKEWDLNICCGKTDGGGINVDVFPHIDIPNFLHISDIYNLPFRDGSFESVLCCDTIARVDDPQRMYNELKRVGKDITLVVTPIWDICSAFNIFKNRYVFLTCRKDHHDLPIHFRLPLAKTVQQLFGLSLYA
jgi:hypothetical protein